MSAVAITVNPVCSHIYRGVFRLPPYIKLKESSIYLTIKVWTKVEMPTKIVCLFYKMSDKATWWSITAFDDEILVIEDVSSYPHWVANVYGGREICPETNREHFQGALQLHTQQRFSKVKNWLKKAHIEPARKDIKTGLINAKALINYAMKEETSAGEKSVRKNPKKFLDAAGICQLIRSKVKSSQTASQKIIVQQFWDAVCDLIVEDPSMTGQLMNPSLRNFYCQTYKAWDRLYEQGNSITLVQSDESSEEGEQQDPFPWMECPFCNNRYNQCECEDRDNLFCSQELYNGVQEASPEETASEASSEASCEGPGAPSPRSS